MVAKMGIVGHIAEIPGPLVNGVIPSPGIGRVRN